VNRWKKNLQTAAGGVRIVNVTGANHYFFLSNKADVLRELRVFIAGCISSARPYRRQNSLQEIA